MIKDIDLQRDEIVQEIVRNAKALNGNITSFKSQTSNDVQAFMELSSREVRRSYLGGKNSINLISF
ncbi:MAG: DUF3164 family protein, partial [Ghiorsea sp.]|nr:DUF3164 family protein [Ghiorsea sp.]